MNLSTFCHRIFVATTCFALCAINSAFSADCANNYFAPGDHFNETPLSSPTKAFASLLAAAKGGDVPAQRSLAVSYEAGYLVSACSKKALYWYGKAAAAGDEIALNRINRHKKFDAMLSGAECAGNSCFDGDPDENRTAILYANAHKGEHYFAPLIINGHTVEGLIDTGASNVAMSFETARQLEINVSDGSAGRSATAAGTISTVSVVVPMVEVAGVKLHNVRVTVGITGEPLIGMSFLSRVNMTMGTGVLAMKKRQ
ncbi:retropepsin-like aspartic protease [Ferribacterium limneticum]|uniref:retropepsin-like aspartic protease n=1 Tax=Ferribacterium limneticum TaxID=76259 RepID=UPI001CF8EBB8|nr:retropepsin-like aspartic protease [Ferribacterium limneticum]UCV24619.1 TIGR02281 family clan AA aspartic protease [Ferribacterium limneticum]